MTSKPAHSDSARVDFGARLRQRREQRQLSLEDIALETRIPLRSLQSLEAGEFGELPADVFVRGFLRSYARCVGLEPDDTVRRYASLGFAPAPVASKMASELMAQIKAEADGGEAAPRKRLARGTGAQVDEGDANSTRPARRFAREWLAKLQARRVEAVREGAGPGAELEPDGEPIVVEPARAEEAASRPVQAAPETAPRAPRPQRPRIFLPSDFSAEDAAGQRGNLTLAVIILVIVATITMSYLMRRPSHAGDGISAIDSIGERLA